MKGWLLDVGTGRNGITLWFKSMEGDVFPVQGRYEPTVYLVPRGRARGSYPAELTSSLEARDDVVSAQVVQRRVRIEDMEMSPVIEARAKNPRSFHPLVDDLSKARLFDLYNIDIPVFQKYLYETGLFPCAFMNARFSRNSRGSMVLDEFELLDDRNYLVYNAPPLKVAWIDARPGESDRVATHRLDATVAKVSVEPDMASHPSSAADDSIFRPFSLERGNGIDESSLILELVRRVREIDPDVILTRGGDEHVFPHLVSRASTLGIGQSLAFSRSGRPLARDCFRITNDGDGSFFSYGRILRRSKTQYYLSGRIHVDTSVYGSLHFQDGNIPGLMEVARVSSVPMQRLNRITIGGALQSIQFMIAHERDLLIPHVKRSAETFKSANNLLLADRGGHIFEPSTGIFDHVISLDFTSMYPMIMTRYNVSPETINCSCCDPSGSKIPGLAYHTCTKRRGIIPDAIEIPLFKRIKYKHHARQLGEKGRRFEMMQAALKWILVVSFGYLGFKNARFGRVEAHQAVCAFSREMLLRSAKIVREHGFEVIHGIVDSIWCRDPHGERDDLEGETKELCKEIEDATRLPIESDGIFKFVVFLPSVVNPNIGTLNRYWGVFRDGRVKVRGIELRRRDAPPLVKALQRDVISALAPARDRVEFMACVSSARQVLERYENALNAGDVDPATLAITMNVSKKPSEYKVNSYQAIASRQLERSGVQVHPGQSIKFVITNAGSRIANDRVMVWDQFTRGRMSYDKRKYRELLKRAFRNLFPFDPFAAKASDSKEDLTLDCWLPGSRSCW